MLKLAVLVSGGGTNLQAIIDNIAHGCITNAEIAVVVSNKRDAYALKRAENCGIKTEVLGRLSYPTQEAYGYALRGIIERENVDLIVLAGFLVVLGEAFVKHFDKRIINVHPSLIPAFCGDGFFGLGVHTAALERGVKLSGATVHYVNEITDGGEIILQKSCEVYASDTPETLQKRVMVECEQDILPRAINIIANTLL